MLHDKIRNPVVEPRIHLTQASVPSRINTVPLYAVDTTIPPPLMTKKEKEESQTDMNTDTKMPQKDGDQDSGQIASTANSIRNAHR